MKSTIFWALLATCFHAGSCSAYFSTLKMEVICSSETSVDFQQTTQHYIPEENLKSYKSYIYLQVDNASAHIAKFSTLALQSR
jgi:hypothetical protein